MKLTAAMMLALCAWPAVADWSPAWTNGSIWAYQRCATDLYNAFNERRALFAAGSYYTITAPTMWPSFAWLCSLDDKLDEIGPKFVDRGQAGTNNQFAAYFADNPTSWAPLYTWSSLLIDAGVTNFRVSATNRTIWPRLSDLMQRRRVLERMTWTRSFWWFDGTQEVDWNGYADNNTASTTNWPALEQVAETNWHASAHDLTADVFAFSRKFDGYPAQDKGAELWRRRGCVMAYSIDAPTEASGAYSVTNKTYRRDVDHYIRILTDVSAVSCATELTGAAESYAYTNCNTYFDGAHDWHGDDGGPLPIGLMQTTNTYWHTETFTQSVAYVGFYVGGTNPVPDWCSNPANPGGGSIDYHVLGYTLGIGDSGNTIGYDFNQSHCVIRWSGLTYP